MVKTNRLYIYQAFTAMFMHENYLHIMGNTIFALFVMY
jgi:membrane associated rhomboid family serine protease